MKQEDENGGAGNPLDENAGFEDMKQEDENGAAGNPLDENAGFYETRGWWSKRMKIRSR